MCELTFILLKHNTYSPAFLSKCVSKCVTSVELGSYPVNDGGHVRFRGISSTNSGMHRDVWGYIRSRVISRVRRVETSERKEQKPLVVHMFFYILSNKHNTSSDGDLLVYDHHARGPELTGWCLPPQMLQE